MSARDTPRLVFDTSPLQALHRCDVLRHLQAYAEVSIPGAVSVETQASVARAGPEKVPRLEEHQWINVVMISDADLEGAGAVLVGPSRSTILYRWYERKIARPELEAILVAERRQARLVVEDAEGVWCAQSHRITVVHVADLLVELERGKYIDDADVRAKAILKTGYYAKELEWLSRRAYP